jgi:septin family protein
LHHQCAIISDLKITRSNTETTLVIIGKQGIRQNQSFTRFISKLFGSYSIFNENNISNIIARLNNLIEKSIIKIKMGVSPIKGNLTCFTPEGNQLNIIEG